MRRRKPSRAAASRRSRFKKLTVLIAVKPAPLSRVIEHLLRHCEGVEILGSVEEASHLLPLAVPRVPDVILANLRFLGKEPGELIAEIKRSSPVSRLVLTSHVEVLPPAARLWGVDAFLAEEALVERLVPLLGRLTQRTPSAHASA